MQQPWFTIHNIHQLDSPALVVYPERMQQNIQQLIAMVNGSLQRLRPHVKTHKMPAVAKAMLAAGITKFKCATIAEAEMLGQCQAPDVLLAYQPAGPKLDRFVELVKKYPNTAYACLVDNMAAAGEIADAFAFTGKRFPVYIDLNVGQNRTGIAPVESALQLYRYCAEKLLPVGLHAYDGHIRHQDLQQRTAICDEAFAKVTQMKNDLVAAGYEPPVIIAGGSPSFPIHAKRPDVECSPGTFIFWDHCYMVTCPEQPFVPAAMLVTRVISLPNERYICLDLGHKSVAAENELSKRVYFPQAPELKPVSQSEEHLVMDAGAGHSYQPGDVLFGIPDHICPTVALYERAYTVENGQLSDEWKIVARDRKITV